MPRWALPAPDAEEEASSSEDENEEEDAQESGLAEEEEEEDQLQDEAAVLAENGTSSPPAKGKIKISLSKSGLVCHVCGKKGHNAGFVGAQYLDCPNKPCYLCKLSGHTTATCPYRFAPDQTTPSPSGSGLLTSMRLREHSGRTGELLTQGELHRHQDRTFYKTDWQVDAAVLKLHSRRCTCLEFHPLRDNLILSGDKKGQVAVWDWLKVYERSVYTPHKALTNNIRFLPSGDGMACCTASSDGILKSFDVETGMDSDLLNLNPEGWIQGVSNERNWRMLYGLDVCRERHLVIAGDTHGYLHFVDARTATRISQQLVHKKGNKVNSVHCNPADNNLVVTASNDWTARMFDLRCLPSSDTHALSSKGKEPAADAFELITLVHDRLVNAAYFSPLSGSKLMTTCIDNRLRIWDTWLGGSGEPTRQIVHSHDFNRYLTPFRAEWDPKDPLERLVVIGRYISEDYGGIALHPIDLMDVGTGRQLAALTDPNLTHISPVNKPHPRLDVIVSGASRSLYAWRPTPDAEEADVQASSSRNSTATQAVLPIGSSTFVSFDAERGMGDGDSDDEGGKKKKRGAGSKAKQEPGPSAAKRKKK